MQKFLKACYLIFFLLIGNQVLAQDLKIGVGDNKELDSLRKKEEGAKDSVVYTAKFIRFTKLSLTKDSIVLLPLDTSTVNIQNYSPLLQPMHPYIYTGVMGLASKNLLYEPTKTIGFNAGFHALDPYSLYPEDILFYRARAPFTNLYFVSAGKTEQVFKAIHTQNINKNLNLGVNFNRADSRGQYINQRGDNLNVAVFSWYQSSSKRYNLWASAIFNNLRAYENGSVLNDSIFSPNTQQIDRQSERIRLNTAKNVYRKNLFFLKQTYYVGRIDSTSGANSNVLPTNKVTHTFEYDSDTYDFSKNEPDVYGVLPKALLKNDLRIDSIFTNDSTSVKHLKNEFMYSFFLRAKNSTVIKNELKVDVGIRHDYYNYENLGIRSDGSKYENRSITFQNLTLLGAAGYRLSSKVDLNVDIQQIFQGRNAGDFLYEAKSNIALSKTFGRIQLGAYLQNKSPDELFNHYNGNHYRWDNNFKNTKIANLSFNYINDKLNLNAGAKYVLTSNFLYFDKNGINSIMPMQETADISLLKIDIWKKWRFGKFVMENYVAYQKNDNKQILRTPEVYTYNSIYFDQVFFKVLKTNIGFDVRYNTSYLAYSYSPGIAQFYVGDAVTFKSEPVIDVFIKANLKRANLFLKYDYINQGLSANGYYTVNRYPMPDKFLKFGVSWNFYD
ncbi:hypothetical protein EZJ43_14230 [Pedobacter changchengzhani]|uniref:Porin n=1 Tax=Pedobacter changchengzhani TaxID=2529274 RepID=A0A4V2ZZZ7_9SPHI|nr:putative porin [Pedobacter changchengzhani]TDG35253.1 hypothetical protein EZJ43_14230 [Pedobacter changchengzhani]